MKYNKNIKKVVRDARIKADLSQVKVGAILGFKNGQYLSQIERGEASFPLGKASDFCDLVGLDKKEMAVAYKEDFKKELDKWLPTNGQ